MLYKYYLLFIGSIFSIATFASDTSKEAQKAPSLKNKNHYTTSEIYEKIKGLPQDKQLKIAKDFARKRITKKIDPNLSPAEVADRLNTLLDNPLYKGLIGVRIKCNVDGIIQPFFFQRCFLKGAKGEADINRWIAPRCYSSQNKKS